MLTQRPTTDRSTAAGRALWFGLLGGAAAWAVQFLAGYLISEGVCVGAGAAAAGVSGAPGAGLFPVASGVATAGISGGVIAVAAVSAAAFVVALLAALTGRRLWLRDREVGDGGTGWVALAGFVLSSVFAFVIVVQVFPLLFGGGCT